MAVIVSLDKHILNYRRLSVCDSRRRLYVLLSKKGKGGGGLQKLKLCLPNNFCATICQDMQQNITKWHSRNALSLSRG